MDDPVPAIPERSAAGEIAAIFADIRQVLAVEVVNLIWRHLATIEGALPWAWSSLRPVYVDGTVAREAAALHAELDLPAIPKVPSEVFTTLGLQVDDLVAIRGILSAYNRTNAMAQIALCALMSRLNGDVESGVDDEDTPTPRAPSDRWTDISLPQLPRLADLPNETAGLVTALNDFGTNRPRPILASMYRHLAHWPPYLGLIWALVAPLDADGRLRRWIADGQGQAQRHAMRVAGRLTAPLPDPKLAMAMRSAIEPFAGDVIARMVVICALLQSVTRHT